jgi:hypothetical protein
MKKLRDMIFGSYGETKICHFHRLYDRWLELA